MASAQDSKATEEEGTEGSEYGADDDDDEDDDEEEEDDDDAEDEDDDGGAEEEEEGPVECPVCETCAEDDEECIEANADCMAA